MKNIILLPVLFHVVVPEDVESESAVMAAKAQADLLGCPVLLDNKIPVFPDSTIASTALVLDDIRHSSRMDAPLHEFVGVDINGDLVVIGPTASQPHAYWYGDTLSLVKLRRILTLAKTHQMKRWTRAAFGVAQQARHCDWQDFEETMKRDNPFEGTFTNLKKSLTESLWQNCSSHRK